MLPLEIQQHPFARGSLGLYLLLFLFPRHGLQLRLVSFDIFLLGKQIRKHTFPAVDMSPLASHWITSSLKT